MEVATVCSVNIFKESRTHCYLKQKGSNPSGCECSLFLWVSNLLKRVARFNKMMPS
jgi:hypothetical protein